MVYLFILALLIVIFSLLYKKKKDEVSLEAKFYYQTETGGSMDTVKLPPGSTITFDTRAAFETGGTAPTDGPIRLSLVEEMGDDSVVLTDNGDGTGSLQAPEGASGDRILRLEADVVVGPGTKTLVKFYTIEVSPIATQLEANFSDPIFPDA